MKREKGNMKIHAAWMRWYTRRHITTEDGERLRNAATLRHGCTRCTQRRLRRARMSGAKPGEDRQKVRRVCLHSSPDFLDGFVGVHHRYSVLPTFVSHTGGGSKPPPYEILYRFFCAPMLGRTLSVNQRRPCSPTGVKGRIRRKPKGFPTRKTAGWAATKRYRSEATGNAMSRCRGFVGEAARCIPLYGSAKIP